MMVAWMSVTQDIFVQKSVDFPEAVFQNLGSDTLIDLKLTWLGSHSLSVYVHEEGQDLLSTSSFYGKTSDGTVSPFE